MQKIITFTFILLSYSAIAQQVLLSGKLMDSERNEIAFAAIVSQNTGKGTSSDEYGNFKMNLSSLNDSLKIHVLGYEPLTYPIYSVKINDTLLIVLKRKSFVLPVVTVKPLDPIEVLKMVIENLPSNLSSEKHTYKAFYRQFHKEDGQAARLIESALNVYHPGNTVNVKTGEIKEKIQVLKLRRSNVYEKNGDEHDNHLNDMLLQNIGFYNHGSVLNPKGWKYYKFKIFYPDHNNNNKVIVSYIYENSSDLKLDYGSIGIDLTDFSILFISQESIMNINYFSAYGADNWKYLKGSISICYKKVDGKMFTDSINFYYKHNVISKKYLNKIFTVEEYFDFYTDDISFTEQATKEHKHMHNLYTKKYEYEESFWTEYPLLLKHPLPFDWQKGMERNESLDKQFEKNERFRIN
ncbi:MAG: carboxypeptidase-like regulatory domain-containing protein [Bacteroidota bacterium]|nr:carboxypeptidase-like regulatory domain-containing protein [Bacteroidota bacterium]